MTSGEHDRGSDVRDAVSWQEHTRDHYNGLVSEYVATYFDDLTDGPWLEAFVRELPRQAAVVDAGCGPGNFTHFLADRGVACVGIDLSEEMVAAAERLVPSARFCVMDFADLAFRDGIFDGVLCAYSLLHAPLEVVPRVLAEFHRVSKRDSVLALLTKLGSGTHELDSPLVTGRTCLVQLIPEDELVALLENHGFEILHKETASAPGNERPFEKIFLLAKAR